MRILSTFAALVLGFGALAAFASRTPVLSLGECLAVTGSVNNKECRDTATCDSYNNLNFAMPICPPAGGSDFCQKCQPPGKEWQTCTTRTGFNCTQSAQPNDCGKQYNGWCGGTSSCGQLVWYGLYCQPAPACTTS